MTDMDERYHHGRLDDNLDRLLKLGNPAPRMPEDLRARIRSDLIEMGPEYSKKSIFSGRLAAWPLAAATLLVAILIVFWPAGSPNTISWADVQKHFDQIRSMTFRGYIEVSTPTGKQIVSRLKVYHKDPGLSRSEQYSPDSDLDTAEPESITLIKRESDVFEKLTLHPDSNRAKWTSFIFHTNSSKPPPQPKHIDLASSNWELFKEITADKTKRIGNRVIGGIPAVGFSFKVPREFIAYPEAVGEARRQIGEEARGQIWTGRDDGVPLCGEVEYQNVQGQTVRMELSDIQWNVALDESFFDLTVPASWDLNRTRFEFTEYTGTSLAPGITLKISPDGQEPLADAGDVAGVIQVMQTLYPGSVIPEGMHITIDLKPAAAKRLHDYADAHPDKIFIVDFNGQINVAAKLDVSSPTQISFSLYWLHLSLAELETNYFTTYIERNKK